MHSRVTRVCAIRNTRQTPGLSRMTPAQRSAQWMADLASVEQAMRTALSELPLHEYTSTLYSFLKRMMKQPSCAVRPHLQKRVPTEDGHMTLECFLVRMSRDDFYRGFERLMLAAPTTFSGSLPSCVSPSSPRLSPRLSPMLGSSSGQDWIEEGEENDVFQHDLEL